MSGALLTLDALGDVEVMVSVELGAARCTIAQVLAFNQGSVVELDARTNAEVQVLVNGVQVACGEMVELENGMLAVEITSVSVDAMRPAR